MRVLTVENKIYYSLRIAAAMCFIGHGIFGILTKPVWCNYFGVFGIDHAMSYNLMPIVGTIDILCGAIILLYPLRAIFVWLVVWGTITALLRPLSGEPFAEFIERAGNFGAPLALLILTSNIRKTKTLLSPVNASFKLSERNLQRVIYCLRIMVFLIIAGHGWLNLSGKKDLLDQYKFLGFANPAETAQIIGSSEIIAAFIVLIRPMRHFILLLFVWKVTSELLYPHYELFEWIERGGSYGCIAALWFALHVPGAIKKSITLKPVKRYLITKSKAYTK